MCCTATWCTLDEFGTDYLRSADPWSIVYLTACLQFKEVCGTKKSGARVQ